MNKTDRLLAIILELQRKGIQRAEDLAATFETSVRTIYRDVQALSEAGVPVVGAPGQGYSLMAGYFLPPVSFTSDEAVALLIGIDFVEQHFDAEYQVNAGTVRSKIEAVLPEAIRRESEQLRASIRLITPNSKLGDNNAKTFALLRQAIREERRIVMIYNKEMGTSAAVPRNPSREIDPYGLIYVGGEWTLVAYCHLRKGLRHFRLSRISRLQLLDETFSYPHDFKLQTYRQVDDRNILVTVLICDGLINKVKEQNYFYIERIDEHQDGFLVTLRVRRPEEVLHWVLGWGGGAVVLEPESLRERIRQEAERMLKRY